MKLRAPPRNFWDAELTFVKRSPQPGLVEFTVQSFGAAWCIAAYAIHLREFYCLTLYDDTRLDDEVSREVWARAPETIKAKCAAASIAAAHR